LSLLKELEEAKALAARAETLRLATVARKNAPAVPLEETTKETAPLPTQGKETPMDVEMADLECLEGTRKRPSTPEIQILSKEEQIKHRVKEHVELWKECKAAALGGPSEDFRALLTLAQESQKALQKLISNEEIEGFVKGWNPWEEKKIHFPAPPKKLTMKFKKKGSERKQSSSSANFSDPARWKKTTELLQIAAGLYKNVH